MRQPAWAAYTRLAVVLHISQTRQQAGQARYRPSSAVVLTELGKLFASLLFAWFEVGNLMKREEREAVSGVNLGLGIPVVHITSDVTVSKEEEERLLSSKDDFEDEKLSGMDSQRRSSGDELSNRSELAEDVESSGGVPRSRCASRSVSIAARLARMRREFLSPDLFTLAIPAIFFTFQNNAQYVAAANLSVWVPLSWNKIIASDHADPVRTAPLSKLAISSKYRQPRSSPFFYSIESCPDYNGSLSVYCQRE